jgi:succinate-semialdehyde dehydrogenase/glutarate-semialdehyde dehydrogenase
METIRGNAATVFDQLECSAALLEDLATDVGCELPNDRETLDVRSPYTDEIVGAVPACTESDISTAVERARAAQSEAKATSVEERIDWLRRFATLCQQHSDRLLDLIQLETGKSRIDAMQEVVAIPGTVGHDSEIAREVLGTRERAGTVPLLTDVREYHEPRGVVGVISPWNYPVTLALTDALPALLAGNAVVFKPDERTPFATLYAIRLLERAGVPSELVQVVTGDGATVGSALIEQIDFVAFTGGVETGRIVGSQAGEQLIDCSLELGGKNPFVVLGDADPKRAARGAVQASFSNAGQLCLAAERIYVHEDVFEPFIDAFVAKTEALSLGATFDFGPDTGSLVGPMQLEVVQEHVADAKERGATVLTGGSHRPDVGPYFFEPTILRDVHEDSLPACEETFGPVVSVYPVASREEAIRRANDTDYGLNASVWTEDPGTGWTAAEAIDAGTVSINDGFFAAWGAIDAAKEPMGDSGIGARHGRQGLLEYTQAKTITRQRFGPLTIPDRIPGEWIARGAFGFQKLKRWLDR